MRTTINRAKPFDILLIPRYSISNHQHSTPLEKLHPTIRQPPNKAQTTEEQFFHAGFRTASPPQCLAC
jgi:hypothetical protein